ncbi:MAG TPA: condensation domain-containing protein, partial [Archangium sp.]|nr:condensation domain-containing protein [Archangium sp.]
MDLSRTVGWFTSMYPVLLEAGDGQTPESGLRAVKETLRRIPRRGLGFGVLRYLSKDEALAARLRALPAAEVSFNYLGQLDTVLPPESPLALTSESVGATQDPRDRRSHRIGVNALVTGGRLQVSWAYGERLYQRETMEALARGFQEALRALLARRTAEDALSVLTPADFPLARLGQPQLDAVVERVAGGGVRGRRSLEDLYPLSPLQQGMLFHVLREPGTSLYFNQLSCELRGALDVSALTWAWRQVMEAHTILRTAVLWEGVDEPLQVVLHGVEIPLHQEDWRGVPASGQEARFSEWLEADRRRSFELSTPPLCRLALLRTGEAAYRFVFSHHHLLMDGWSVPLLIKQVFALYDQQCRGQAPGMERTRPFGDYIGWIQGRSLEESERFWRRSLAGFSEPTDVGRGFPEANGSPVSGRASRHLQLSAATTEAVNAFARQRGLTLNTVVQGAWALLLGHHAGTRDVVFGTTVSGRPPELAGVEAMVGLFINTLPVRVRLPGDEPLLPWLQRLQAWLLEMRQHEHSPLVKVQRWSEVPAGTPLFESLVVFENYPVDEALSASLPSLEVRDVRAVEEDHYPLTLVAVPGRELRLELAHERSRFDADHVDRMLEQLRSLLEAMAARPEQRLRELSPVDMAGRQRLLKEWSRAGGPSTEPAVLHRLFEEQVARTPDAEALVSGSERLTYADLDARANQLAHHLRGLGVRAESRVVLCLERSVELIVSMLGVLKAGGVYVPVDPAWPAARLQLL